MFTKRVFNFEYASDKRGSWCRFIKSTLRDLDLQCVFRDKQTCDLSLCKVKLQEIYQTKWSDDLKKKPKLRTYVQIKDKFEPELYVKLNLEKHQRSLLAQLRTGVLPLHIETGRFQNKKLEDRVCNICNTGAVESEYHFLFYCSLFHQLTTR